MGKPFTIEPSGGGQLRTALSAERPGILNYVKKGDFRRDLDQEVRREGHDYFWPILGYGLGNQPFPQNQPDQPAVSLPINLIHLARAANGEFTVVAGTETTLYTFYPARVSTIGPYFEPGEIPNDEVIVGPHIDVGPDFIPWVGGDPGPHHNYNPADDSAGSGTDFHGGGTSEVRPPYVPPPGTPTPGTPDTPIDPIPSGGGETPGGAVDPKQPKPGESTDTVYVSDPIILSLEGYELRDWVMMTFLEPMIQDKIASMISAGWSNVRCINKYWAPSGALPNAIHSAEYWHYLGTMPEPTLAGHGFEGVQTAWAMLAGIPPAIQP